LEDLLAALGLFEAQVILESQSDGVIEGELEGVIRSGMEGNAPEEGIGRGRGIGSLRAQGRSRQSQTQGRQSYRPDRPPGARMELSNH